MPTSPTAASVARYELLAREREQQIAAGVLRPGDRLPSVRQTRASRGLSPSTVFQANYLLESRGLVRAAPRSGYFVAARAGGVLLAEPQTSEPQSGSRSVEVNDLIYACLGSARARDIVPFGSAFPSPTLFPLDRLRRALVSSTRRLEPWNMVEDLPSGNLRLKREIAKRYLRQGMTVVTDEIVRTHGAMEALNLCLNAVARPGDAVVVESPTFYVDDETPVLHALRRLLQRHFGPQQLGVELCADPLQALQRLRQARFDVVLSDCRMPRLDGVTLLARARELHPRTVRLMPSAVADFGTVLAAVNRAEIFRSIPKPWSEAQLLADLRAALAFDPCAASSDAELERRRLEALEPGITQVEWALTARC